MSKNPDFFKVWMEIEYGCVLGNKRNISISKKKMRNVLISCLSRNGSINNSNCELYSDLINGSIVTAVERRVCGIKRNSPVMDKEELDSVINFILNAVNI